MGFNVFVFDYRGYGASQGKPDRKGLHKDARAALEYVAARGDVNPTKLIVLGQSLGAANAAAAIVEADVPEVRAVILDSPFYSYRSITREKMEHIPIISLLRWPLSYMVIGNSYSAARYIRDLAPIPLLIIHGTDDQVIPYAHSERLFARAREPKELWKVEGGRHTDALTKHGDEFRPRLLEYVHNVLNAR